MIYGEQLRRHRVPPERRYCVVYALLDSSGQVGYVGRTQVLKSRLHAHRKTKSWFVGHLVLTECLGIKTARAIERHWVRHFSLHRVVTTVKSPTLQCQKPDKTASKHAQIPPPLGDPRCMGRTQLLGHPGDAYRHRCASSDTLFSTYCTNDTKPRVLHNDGRFRA